MRDHAAPQRDDRPSIAVLPFRNMSPSPENEYFSDGITEEILTTLARLRGLKVISRTSVMQYKETGKNVRQIAEELGVATVLEGSVRHAGERVRITAQLIDATTDEHIWAERYDHDLEDIFAIQSDVAGQIVEALRVRLTPRERARIEKRPTESIEAYEWYLKARFHIARRTGEALRQAQTALERAVEIDPGFARAWGALATVWALLPSYSGTSIEEAAPRVREAAQQALALDPALGEPHAALGLTAMNEWAWDEAGRELEQAIERAPSWATARQWYGNFLMFQGRPDEAIATLRRALELDPLAMPIHMTLGGAYYFARRFEEALQVHRTALELDPDYVPEHVNLAGVLMQLGRTEEGIEAMAAAARLDPGEISPEWVAEFRAGFLAAGRQGFREAYVEGLRARPGVWARRFNMATGLAELGRKDEAIALLEELVAEHDQMAIQIGVQPSFDVLRGDSRFEALLRKVGLGRSP